METLEFLKSHIKRERSKHRESSVASLCAYVPRELPEALSLHTFRESACGTVKAESTGEKKTSPYVCSWCKALLGSEKQYWHMIGCSTCDQMRRMLEIMGRTNDGKVNIINIPATRTEASRDYYLSEIDRFCQTLENKTGKKVDHNKLKEVISKRNAIRQKIREIRPGLTGSQMTALIHCEYLLSADKMISLLENLETEPSVETNIRLLVAGSPISFEEIDLLEQIESLGVSIVADATCTGDRAVDLYVSDEGELLKNLANAYFQRSPCAWMRPNDEFYDWTKTLIKERNVQAVLWRTYKNCDIWNLEAQRAREKYNLPLLPLDVTSSDFDNPRVKNRIEAFFENMVE